MRTRSRLLEAFRNMHACVLSGIWMTADVISVERREATLGFLFLTI